jgi:cell wall-associated NlpC family hydrolase|tara:strand:+ start:212 stop:955 length:744 start_codon:yes stop_codon:yes gene_type:complete
MIKYYTNTFSIINLYRESSTKSEIVTQMIYGESFSILKKKKQWLKIKIKEDNYKGYIKLKNFSNYLKPTHKINKLKVNIYKSHSTKKKINELTFGSKIMVTDQKSVFLKFFKGWIHKKDVSSVSFKEKNIFKKIRIFKNIKYKWGGKSFKGIDCSALIQIFLNFNNFYCPRDTKDQIKYFKKNIKLINLKKNDIMYWKGHVAVALSKKKLIHAYGPIKKTVVMDVYKTIKKIKDTANLKLEKIKRLN